MEEQPTDPQVRSGKKPPEIEKLFRVVIKSDASDLHLKVGMPPKIRIHSKLKSTTGDPLTAEKVEQLVFEIMSPEQREIFQ
jgi:twitching motility protein PilT